MTITKLSKTTKLSEHREIPIATTALQELLSSPNFRERIAHVEETPAHPGKFTQTVLYPTTRAALTRIGISRLYAHQAEALDFVRRGQSTVVATGTASGKSLCYLLPLLEMTAEQAGKDGTAPGANLSTEKNPTAILLFPTKALARDQLRRLRALQMPGLEAVAVDGDTPPAKRRYARQHATVILTNPDMLHASILPGHPQWASFLRRLHLVGIDEFHTYRGVFGSHVAHIMRRLRRLAASYAAHPVFVCSSATLGKPAQHAAAITGIPMHAITQDTSPSPPRSTILWNPPLLNAKKGIRVSGVGETAALLGWSVAHGMQTLAFARSRKAAELIAHLAKQALGDSPEAAQIACYRGGYLSKERRALEEQIASGELRGLSTTNALELGMDIHGLDAVILCGFPSTIASFRQQTGRAGRGDTPSLAILVAGQDQLDQWYMTQPEALFTRTPTPAVVNSENPVIADPHLACAAYELPLRSSEPILGENMDVRAAPLLEAGLLRMRKGRLFPSGGRSLARSISIRSSDARTVSILNRKSGQMIGSVDTGRAAWTVHPGAIYLHQGETYEVTELDITKGVAHATPSPTEYYTEPRAETDIRIAHTDRTMPLGDTGALLCLGSVEVTQRITGYRQRPFDRPPSRNTKTIALDLPAKSLHTRAFWYLIPDELFVICNVSPDTLQGTIHACEHAGIGILPLFAICDRWDIGGVSTQRHPQTGVATWFIHEGTTGGTGIAEEGFATGRAHAEATLHVVESCTCTESCPGCVQSPKCGNWNEPLDKAGAVLLLQGLLKTKT